MGEDSVTLTVNLPWDTAASDDNDAKNDVGKDAKNDVDKDAENDLEDDPASISGSAEAGDVEGIAGRLNIIQSHDTEV